jgi:hypothetical protein
MSVIHDVHVTELAQRGYTLLEGIETDEDATEALSGFGQIVPQYDGSLRYQVKAAPGFEDRSYSKSTNTISVHTEAPGWNPPPTYLALHCHVQAACGSGHTELADTRKFMGSLTEGDRAILSECQIDWPGYGIGGSGSQGARCPVVEVNNTGREIFRFSFNLLTTGQYEPSINTYGDPERLPLRSFGRSLAKQAEEFFRECKIAILIPERSILIWDNRRMMHARSSYRDERRHLTRYWVAAESC